MPSAALSAANIAVSSGVAAMPTVAKPRPRKGSAAAWEMATAALSPASLTARRVASAWAARGEWIRTASKAAGAGAAVGSAR